MNKILGKLASVRYLFVFVFLTLAEFSAAGDFVSVIVQANQQPTQITVPGDRFLVIRNFTQESGAAIRGTVTVDTSTFTGVTVLTATLLNPNNTTPGSLEVVNDIVIAGPATVNVNSGDTNCFITYRKGTD
jgi:hypothetical protein